MALRGIGTPTIQSLPLAELLTTNTARSSALSRPTAPTPPWRKTETPAELSAALKAALSGAKLIDESATQLDVRGESEIFDRLLTATRELEHFAEYDYLVVNDNLEHVGQAAFVRGLLERR